jgi:hypothetical protein
VVLPVVPPELIKKVWKADPLLCPHHPKHHPKSDKSDFLSIFSHSIRKGPPLRTIYSFSCAAQNPALDTRRKRERREGRVSSCPINPQAGGFRKRNSQAVYHDMALSAPYNIPD